MATQPMTHTTAIPPAPLLAETQMAAPASRLRQCRPGRWEPRRLNRLTRVTQPVSSTAESLEPRVGNLRSSRVKYGTAPHTKSKQSPEKGADRFRGHRGHFNKHGG